LGWDGSRLICSLFANAVFYATGFIELVIEFSSKTLLAKCFGYASQEWRTQSALTANSG